MASTRDLRRKIRSVKNTSQLTKAMKMVSAAKLRRAQEAMQAARPYAEALRHVLPEVARRAHPELHPLLTRRDPRCVDLILVVSDKGLCGAFNTNALKTAEKWRLEHEAAGRKVVLTVVGRKGVDFYRRRGVAEVREGLVDIYRGLNYLLVRDIAQKLEQRYIAGETDGVSICYNEFRSAASYRAIVRPLLPLSGELGQSDPRQEAKTEYIYEPDPQSLLDTLLPQYVAFQLWQAMLESQAAEHGARMASMDNATRNANELIAKLTLRMNRVRQAAITTEIIEVVSGADALG